jgi:hypothetical protein
LGWTTSSSPTTVALFVGFVLSASGIVLIVRRLGPGLWAPPFLVSLAYCLTAGVAFFGRSGQLGTVALGARVVWLHFLAIACFVTGWGAAKVLRRINWSRVSRLSPAQCMPVTHIGVARVLLGIATAGAVYRFRGGLPILSNVQVDRFVVTTGPIDALAALAYSATFLAFLLLLPSTFGRWATGRRPWPEFIWVVLLTAVEGNRRFTILFLCALVYATWSGAKIPPVRAFFVAALVLLAFSIVGDLRVRADPALAAQSATYLSRINYSEGPSWLAPGYLALRGASEIVDRAASDPTLSSDSTRPRPITLAGPASFLPGHQESPDFWLRRRLSPESNQTSGLAIPLIASLLLDGGVWALAGGFFLLGGAASWCRSAPASPLLMLAGVCIVSSTVLGVYGVFLGTPQYTIAILGLAILGAWDILRRPADSLSPSDKIA